MENMELSLRDVYQLLLTEGRYAYTRNNHLMPSAFYDRVHKLIEKMVEINKESGLDTLKQIVEECISLEIVANFEDGEDDKFGNRQESIDFVARSLKYIHSFEGEDTWQPYNYADFQTNVAKDDEPRYMIYQMNKFDGDKAPITEKPLSKKEYLNSLCKFFNDNDIVYRKESVNDKVTIYHIQEPVKTDMVIEHI